MVDSMIAEVGSFCIVKTSEGLAPESSPCLVRVSDVSGEWCKGKGVKADFNAKGVCEIVHCHPRADFARFCGYSVVRWFPCCPIEIGQISFHQIHVLAELDLRAVKDALVGTGLSIADLQ